MFATTICNNYNLSHTHSLISFVFGFIIRCSTCFYFTYPSYPDHPHTLRLTSKKGGDCAPTWRCSCCNNDVEFAYTCKECEANFLVCKRCFNGIHGKKQTNKQTKKHINQHHNRYNITYYCCYST